ncbi:pyrimidine reductase family protein [Galactobacter caseinivorans]|uniref:Pyrimidine reductase family protein n=2 Tax=Galactobacter caseinivorans TaxID=2676123 RepID=A0A496PMI5_9MICC|nr:pyrimidine reductase family protein [Galactobacter caseinivorans]
MSQAGNHLYAERMRRFLPVPGPDLTDTDLLDEAASPTPGQSFVRFNMVSSLDGRGVLDGLSAGLGTAADQRLFPILRAVADAIVVGSATALAEGYAGELLPQSLRQARVARGLAARPTTVILSHSGSLPPDSAVLQDAPAPTLVVVAEDASPERIAALRAVCEVVLVPAGTPPIAVTSALAGRGLAHLHHEGGPGILTRYVNAGAVDSLCLTLSPVLAPAGTGAITAMTPVTGHAQAPVRALELHRLYEEDSTLLAEYRRGRAA